MIFNKVVKPENNKISIAAEEAGMLIKGYER